MKSAHRFFAYLAVWMAPLLVIGMFRSDPPEVPLQYTANHYRPEKFLNPLLANRQSLTFLAATSLSSGTYTGTDPASTYLRSQLASADARESMELITACALDGSMRVEWATATKSGEWQGELGLCPVWSTTALSNLPGPDAALCRQKVTACMLARMNKYGLSVSISLRGLGLPALTAEEAQKYQYIEGGFWGDILDPAGLDASGLNIQLAPSGFLVASMLQSKSGPLQSAEAIVTWMNEVLAGKQAMHGADRRPEDATTTREAAIAPPVGAREPFVPFGNAWACATRNYAEAYPYLKTRICAEPGPEGQQVCIAKPLGICEPPPADHAGACQTATFEVSNLHALGARGHFNRCGTPSSEVIASTALDDPCALLVRGPAGCMGCGCRPPRPALCTYKTGQEQGIGKH